MTYIYYMVNETYTTNHITIKKQQSWETIWQMRRGMTA